jgi:anti-sigma B factor antagonist
MSVETVRLDQLRALVKARGAVDLTTSAPLWGVLASHLAAGRRFLRLDLSDVTFLDASALTGLTRIHHDALERRGTLVLTGINRRVERVLRLAGLDRVLFLSGPRADDDVAPSDVPRKRAPLRWPARPVPWTPPGLARRTLPAHYDR